MGLNKQYKDSVFSLLFSEPDILRELYGAICGVPLDPSIPVTINTLEGALFMERINEPVPKLIDCALQRTVLGQVLAVFQAFSLTKLRISKLLSQKLKFWESL